VLGVNGALLVLLAAYFLVTRARVTSL